MYSFLIQNIRFIRQEGQANEPYFYQCSLIVSAWLRLHNHPLPLWLPRKEVIKSYLYAASIYWYALSQLHAKTLSTAFPSEQ